MLNIFMDRRAQKRVPYKLEISFKVMDNINIQDDTYKKAQIKNISSGGLCLQYNQSLKIGNMVRVNFLLNENNKMIDTFCEVKWCKRFIDGFLIGLSFITLTEEEQESIINLVGQYN